MKIDRVLQKTMLENLASCYPHFSTSVVTKESSDFQIANLYYLQEHGLVEASLDQTLSGAFIFSGARITAKGLDFLTDDGGLSAILGTITVKLHGDSIKDLLQAKLEQSTLPQKEKSWIKTQISTLSGEALKAITKSLVEQGLQNIPNYVEWVKSALTTIS